MSHNRPLFAMKLSRRVIIFSKKSKREPDENTVNKVRLKQPRVKLRLASYVTDTHQIRCSERFIMLTFQAIS